MYSSQCAIFLRPRIAALSSEAWAKSALFTDQKVEFVSYDAKFSCFEVRRVGNLVCWNFGVGKKYRQIFDMSVKVKRGYFEP